MIKLKVNNNHYSTHKLVEAIEYDYIDHCTCCNPQSLSLTKTIESYASSKDDLEKAIAAYLKDIASKYNLAIDKTIKQIAQKIGQLNNASLQQVNDIIIFNLLNNWQDNFTAKARKSIQQNIDKYYRQFRFDKKVFGRIRKGIPEPTLSLTDLRTIEFFANTDEFYLGKFITDIDTRRRFTRFIKEQYVAGNLQPNDLSLFKKEFKDTLKGEDFKISRIISTTVTKMRTYAGVNFMTQAEIEKFEIVGINDRLQCPYCAELQGMQFSVASAQKKIEDVIDYDPALIPSQTPFITAIFKSPEELKGKTSDDLQAAGIDMPPFHPNCRDRITAII